MTYDALLANDTLRPHGLTVEETVKRLIVRCDTLPTAPGDTRIVSPNLGPGECRRASPRRSTGEWRRELAGPGEMVYCTQIAFI